MKRIFFLLTLLLGCFALFFESCGKDPSPSPTDPRSQYLGQWSVTETKKKLTYEVNITADVNSTNGVLIYNFGSFGTSIAAGASVSGNTITLDANQEIVPGVTITGSGSLSGTKITWIYKINDGANLVTVTAIYTKI